MQRLSMLFWLCMLLSARDATAADVCTCAAGDHVEWHSVSATTGSSWSCTAGDGVPGSDDHFVVAAGCHVEVLGDILQDPTSLDSGIRVEPGGVLEARAGGGGKRTLSLGGRGFECLGDCTLEGVFRRPDGSAPSLDPVAWQIESPVPCNGDCQQTPELACFSVDSPDAQGIGEIQVASDLGVGTRDWLCFWDFDKSDHRASFDDNACYPVAEISQSGGEICVDARQGRDSDYPHRLRRLHELRVAQPIAAGEGCGVVLDRDDGTRAASCAGSVLRVDPAPGQPDAIQHDDELIGRFIRFAEQGLPADASYKILQTFDCSGAPAFPHVCEGDDADVVVIGRRSGLASAVDAGSNAWIDYGWRRGDEFFVMTPVQLQSATPDDDDSGVLIEGRIHAQGVHFTDLGGGRLDTQPQDVVRLGGADVTRWRHVIIRNDTGSFIPNNGADLNPDALQYATLGHTNIIANSGHAVLIGTDLGPTNGLVLEDFSIRHHQDGCFNHSAEEFTPEVTVRRSWCAFIQSDAMSAQWFALQLGDPSLTVIEDSACDACDGGHSGDTLRSNATVESGWTLRRSLLWSPLGGLPSGDNQIEDVLFLGLRGDHLTSAPLLGTSMRHSVMRGLAIHSQKALLQGSLDVRGSLLRDVLVSRPNLGAVIATDGSHVEGSAFLDFDTRDGNCAAGNIHCVVLQESSSSEDVAWEDIVVAWRPGATTRLAGAMRYRAQQAQTPPSYRGIAIAYHQFEGGGGTAFTGLTASNVGTPDWDDGPCFQDNDLDVPASVETVLPPETSQGIPLGFVDPDSGRFDVPEGSHADQVGCGIPPESPAGTRGYHYIHARTGLSPELMADDTDEDGWPENVPALPCNGTSEHDCLDNCVARFNPDQADVDGDGQGNACDSRCADGQDNDADGFIDFPDDPECSSYADNQEGPGGCGLGFELAPLLIGIWRLRVRGRRMAGRNGR